MSAPLDLSLPTQTAIKATTTTTPAPMPATLPPADATVICSALALMGNPLAGLDMQYSYAERILATVRARHSNTEILNWRSDTTPAEWDLRWRWARKVTLRHYPAAPGAADLPLDHFTAPQLTNH